MYYMQLFTFPRKCLRSQALIDIPKHQGAHVVMQILANDQAAENRCAGRAQACAEPVQA